MNFLIIDGALKNIYFFSQFNNNSYNKSFESNKINYENFSLLLINFLKDNNIELNKLNHIFINQGPGNFSGIRTSIAVAKGLSIVNKLDLYGFNSNDVKNMNYENIVLLYKQGNLKKNLIKPLYLS